MTEDHRSPDRQMLVGTVARLVDDETDETALRAAETSGTGWMPALWQSLATAGFVGLGSNDGAGGDLLDDVLVATEVGRSMAPLPAAESGAALTVMTATGLAPGLVDDVRDGTRLVVPLVVPDPESAVLASHVVRFATAADAMLLLSTSTSEVAVVEPDMVDTVQVQSMDPFPVARVRLRGLPSMVRAPQAVAQGTEFLWLLRSAIAVGGMRAALDYAVEYVSERRQFGRSVGSFQAVQHRLADAAIDAELGTHSVMDAATRPADDRRPQSVAAVRHCLPAYQRVAAATCQVLGGYGFSMEYAAQRHFRLATALRLGTPPAEPSLLMADLRRQATNLIR
ncbi:Butyryl-CoA dehydrogenase [Euzebya pacifica]|uniref:Butyryl-CoA dehydrogenase n=1 Tax=Euzebya pacifica TaxID=1608957 RepID=A0A346XWQ7_9ACTN|nr:acyl-CoA dehydrogenase [Euzebya pacifica]AXV06654.1 Butyryl-CoA dehydrogenase [Euzebya pacifica]